MSVAFIIELILELFFSDSGLYNAARVTPPMPALKTEIQLKN